MARISISRLIQVRRTTGLLWAILSLSGLLLTSRADQVEMQNGDRYFGKVLSLSSNTVVFQNELLGTLHLPRGKVASIAVGTDGATNRAFALIQTNAQARLPTARATNGTPDFSAILRGLGADTNMVQQVQKQFLSGAGPEAKDKFNELLSGLMNGKVTIDDLRTEAKSAAERLRAARKDLGEDSSWSIDSYLAILDHFLSGTAPLAGASTNAAKPLPKEPGARSQEPGEPNQE